MPDFPVPKAVDYQPDLNEVVLSWKSPSHPFRKRNKVYYQTLAALTLLLVIITIFFGEYLLMLTVIATAFLFFAISRFAPVEVEHKVTPLGFENIGRVYKWAELGAFWFERKLGEEILVIQTHLPFPPQIRVVITQDMRERVKEILGKYLLYSSKPKKTWIDKVTDWISDRILLESTT